MNGMNDHGTTKSAVMLIKRSLTWNSQMLPYLLSAEITFWKLALILWLLKRYNHRLVNFSSSNLVEVEDEL